MDIRDKETYAIIEPLGSHLHWTLFWSRRRNEDVSLAFVDVRLLIHFVRDYGVTFFFGEEKWWSISDLNR